VRFPALVSSALSAVFFYSAAKEMLEDKGKAENALLLFLFMPLLSVTSIAIFPDTTLILSWTIALWAGWKALKDERYWLLVGAAVGTAILSKLIGFFLVLSVVSFFLMNKTSRPWLKNKFVWGGMCLALAISGPFWIWNAGHGFENLFFQVHDHLGGTRPNPWLSFLGYLGVQSLNVSPLLFILMIPTIIGLIKRSREGEVLSSYLLAFALPIHVVFFLLSFYARVGFHWALPGYISLCIALADRADFKKAFRLGLAVAIALTLLFYGVLGFPAAIATELSPLSRHFPQWKIDSFFSGKGYGEILGYRELSAVAKERFLSFAQEKPFLLTGSYTLSSDLWYYTGIPVKTALFSGQGGEYSRWNHFERLKGRNALWIDLVPFSEEPTVLLTVERAFSEIGQTQTLTVRQGTVTRFFYMTMLYDLQHPSALPAASEPSTGHIRSMFP